MSNRATRLALFAMIGGSVAACADTGYVGAGPTDAQVAAARVAAAQSKTAAPRIAGPKHSVMVGKFQSIGSFTQQYGEADAGGGLTAMLTSALVQSGHFVVMENPPPAGALPGVIGTPGPDAGADTARAAGAQFLIVGAVTESGVPNAAGGLASGAAPVGLSVGQSSGLLSMLSGGASARTVGGSVAIDLRLIDTATNQVMQTATVREDATTSDVSLTGGYGLFQLGGERVSESPLGRAARTAISKAVASLIATADQVAWRGLVVEAEGADLIINAGQTMGIRPGDRFTVERVGRSLTDPATGETLATRLEMLGSLQVDQIEAKIARGHYTAVSAEAPQRGDVVVPSASDGTVVATR